MEEHVTGGECSSATARTGCHCEQNYESKTMSSYKESGKTTKTSTILAFSTFIVVIVVVLVVVVKVVVLVIVVVVADTPYT